MGEYDKSTDSLAVMPSPLEAFIKGFLNHHLASNITSGSMNTEAESIQHEELATSHETPQTNREPCKSSADCHGNSCNILYHTEVKKVCVNRVCVCPVAHYHLALDPAFEAEDTPGYFHVIEAQDTWHLTKSANGTFPPLVSGTGYTEPYWDTLRVGVYTSATATMEMVIFGTGLAAAFLSVLSGYLLNNYLVKEKLV